MSSGIWMSLTPARGPSPTGCWRRFSSSFSCCFAAFGQHFPAPSCRDLAHIQRQAAGDRNLPADRARHIGLPDHDHDHECAGGARDRMRHAAVRIGGSHPVGSGGVLAQLHSVPRARDWRRDVHIAPACRRARLCSRALRKAPPRRSTGACPSGRPAPPPEGAAATLRTAYDRFHRQTTRRLWDGLDKNGSVIRSLSSDS